MGLGLAGSACALVFACAAAPALAQGVDVGRGLEPQPRSEVRYDVQPPSADPERLDHVVKAADGVELFVETWVPKARAGGPQPPPRVPVILVNTPYTHKDHPYLAYPDTPARGNPLEYFVSRGYAVSVAHVRGTGESGGCIEQTASSQIDDGARVIEYLGRDAPFSDGNVGMYGKSYDAETQLSVAGRGDPVRTKYLKAIIPVATVGGQYEYNNFDGVPYTGVAAQGQAVYIQYSFAEGGPDNGVNIARLPERASCQGEQTLVAADLSGDFTPYWQDREYRPGAPNIRAATLFVHGLFDLNVKALTQVGLFDRIPDTTPHKLILGQWAHDFPNNPTYRPEWGRDDWLAIALAWYDRYLKGEPTQVESWPAVQVQDVAGQWRAEAGWGDTGGPAGQLALGSAGALGVTAPTGSDSYDEATGGFLTFETAPVEQALRLTGQAVADLWVTLSYPDAHVDATLQVVRPDGTVTPGETTVGHRSARHLEPMPTGYFEQATGIAPPTGTPVRVPVRLLPQDLVVPAGGRLRLLIAAPNQETSQANPSGAPGTVIVLHDCAHPSALRFLMPSEHPDLLDVLDGTQPGGLGRTPAPATVAATAGGLATALVCGAAPIRPARSYGDTAAPPTPQQPAKRVAAKPSLSAVKLARRTVRRRSGTTLSFRLDQAAKVEFRIARCARKAKRCARPKVVSSRTLSAKAGTTRLRRFGQGLRAGRYRLTAVARGTTGRSAAVTLSFRVR
jgi:X-Pro dipeptidyl-peptidase